MMKYIAIACLHLCLTFSINVPNAHSAKENITEFHSGIKIVWKLQEDELVQMAKVKRFDRYAIVRVIKNELQKYPKGFLGEIIDTIYLARTAKVHGVPIGGLAKPIQGEKGNIYLTSWNEPKPVLAHKLHHEIAHHLLVRSPASHTVVEKWMKLLPEGFQYFGNGLEAAKAGIISSESIKNLNKQGFISAYAATSIHEDFAELAGAMVTGDKETWNMIDDNPVMMEKAKLVAELLQSMDPKYTIKYIRYRF